MIERSPNSKVGLKTSASSRQTPCNVKNGACVPKCSELSDEEVRRGAQCALDFGNVI